MLYRKKVGGIDTAFQIIHTRKENDMKIKALIDYYDTHEERNIKKDEVYETTDERADLIISHKYAEKVEAKKRGRKKKDAVPEASDL